MQPKHLGVDGFPRSKDKDKIISQNVQSLFNTPTGIDGANQVIYFVNTGGFFFMSAELGA